MRGNEGICSLPVVNCNDLIEIAIKEADKRIVWYMGIQGTIRKGVIIETGFDADAAIPLDLVFDASIGNKHNPFSYLKANPLVNTTLMLLKILMKNLSN